MKRRYIEVLNWETTANKTRVKICKKLKGRNELSVLWWNNIWDVASMAILLSHHHHIYSYTEYNRTYKIQKYNIIEHDIIHTKKKLYIKKMRKKKIYIQIKQLQWHNVDDTVMSPPPQLKVRDERLGEASDLQKFLQNLDHFQQWLTRTQTTIASEDIPSDLAEAERLLSQHEQIKSEIDGYADEYALMKNYGKTVVEGQDDVQYMFLREVSRCWCSKERACWNLTFPACAYVAFVEFVIVLHVERWIELVLAIWTFKNSRKTAKNVTRKSFSKQPDTWLLTDYSASRSEYRKVSVRCWLKLHILNANSMCVNIRVVYLLFMYICMYKSTECWRHNVVTISSSSYVLRTDDTHHPILKWLFDYRGWRRWMTAGRTYRGCGRTSNSCSRRVSTYRYH